MTRNRLFLLVLLASHMCVAHLVIAGDKAITVTITDGLTVKVPVPSAVPAFTTPLEGGDIYSLYDQESFFWKYRLYKKLDLNRDGRVDYYMLVEAFFGPHAGDVDILVEWRKAKLEPAEEAAISQQEFMVLDGQAGTDYRPLLYTIARQSASYRSSSTLPQSIEMKTGITLIRQNPGESLTAVSYDDFRNFLVRNCRK